MKILGIFGFVIGAILVASDLLLDEKAGGSHLHLLAETLILSICVFGLIYSVKEWLQWKKRWAEVTQRLDEAHEEARLWKKNHGTLIQGLSQAIDEQFEKWKLTESEKEIALLLIKGLSHKEIAYMRKCTEKTVRTHSTAVYQKSDLTGRAELAAFFLEDLLAPTLTT